MTLRKAATQAACIVLLLTVLPLTSNAQDGPGRGTKAPAFDLPSVGGRTVALREFENKKVVIVHFWKSK